MQRIDDEHVGGRRAALGQRVEQRGCVPLEFQERVGEIHRIAADFACLLVGGVFAVMALADAGDEARNDALDALALSERIGDRPENRGSRAPPDRVSLQAAVAEANRLDAVQRAVALRALEEIVRDDPAALELIRAAQK